jgi:hypothetical protein
VWVLVFKNRRAPIKPHHILHPWHGSAVRTSSKRCEDTENQAPFQRETGIAVRKSEKWM